MKNLEEIIEIRRDLHKIPETGFNEFKTQKYIIEYLKSLGYTPEIICETGVILHIKGESEECIAFRADMDGLNIQENSHSFCSTHNGYMHACGHDGHMTILLSFAKELKNISLKKSVLLIFQPAEEGPGGAYYICKENILKKYNVKEIYGLHLFPDLEEGIISTKAGAFFAQATEFDCKIIGKGGHGGIPHKTIDPIIPFCKTIDSYQTIISRNLSPFSPSVITVGKFQGGDVRNIISNIAEYSGTIRAYDKEDTNFIIKRMKEIHRGIEVMFNVKIEEDFRILYPPIQNSEVLYKNFLKISNKFNFIPGEPLAIADDFAFYQEEVPGIFFLLGTKNLEKGFNSPLHNPNFNFDEKVLITGINLFKEILIDRMEA